MRSDLLDFKLLHVRKVLHEADSVRIAHRDAGQTVFLPEDLDRRKNRRPSGCIRERRRNRRSFKDRSAHINTNLLRLPVLHRQCQGLNACSRRNFHDRLIGHSVIIDILSDAADPVPAHFSAAAVRIVHLHLKIRDIRRFDQDKPVRPDSEMSVAHEFGDLCRILKLCLRAVDINIIVADTVHLRKPHIRTPPHLFEFSYFLRPLQYSIKPRRIALSSASTNFIRPSRFSACSKRRASISCA